MLISIVENRGHHLRCGLSSRLCRLLVLIVIIIVIIVVVVLIVLVLLRLRTLDGCLRWATLLHMGTTVRRAFHHLQESCSHFWEAYGNCWPQERKALDDRELPHLCHRSGLIVILIIIIVIVIVVLIIIVVIVHFHRNGLAGSLASRLAGRRRRLLLILIAAKAGLSSVPDKG